MADSFLYGFAGDILKRVASVVEKEIVLAVGVKEDLIDFKKTLSTVEAGILDAEKRPDKRGQLQDWLRRLNDVCYDAEDMLDEFEYETLRRPVVADQVSVTMKVCKFFSNTNPRFRCKMGHKLLNIKKRLDEIANDKNKFGLTKRDEDGHTVLTDRETDSMPSSEVIGRRDDIETIIELLTRTSDEENVSVIPISGMPGQGKTTLAQMLCNDKRVADHFEKIIWVWVSQDFNIKNIVNRIISACDKDCGDLKYKDQQTKHLQKTLQNKLYLIVLDDVWEIDKGKWVGLKNLLMGGARGSKIIVTTRDRLVAQNVCSKVGYIHELGYLPDPECLSLFVNWAFEKGEAEQFPRQLEIGKEIVKKCGGLPLAVRTLGIILSETRELKDWLEVKNSEIQKLEHRGNDVSPTLKLSYDRLPSHLQKCFAFCSIFPKNYKFTSLELIRLWIAHGLVKSSDAQKTELEDIGRKYIKQLRSLFQNVKEHGHVLTFEMHDLIHDLAVSVAHSDVSSGTIYSKSDRHLSFTENLPPTKSNVRTIIHPNGGAISKSFAKKCISRFKYLRVLDLGDSEFEALPRSIGKLKLLRYLSLYNSSIKKLPNSICNLLNLQTLDLSNCKQLEKLPRDIGNLISLRCLYITTKQESLLEDGIERLKMLRFLGIVGCRNLISLGEGTKHLTSLQTLLIGDCKSLESLPHSMNHLTALETLFIYNCEKLNLMVGEEDMQGLGLGLQSLWIACLPQLEGLPQWLQEAAKTIEYICIGGCPKLTALPSWLDKVEFISLKNLVIEDCPELSALPEEMQSSLASKLNIKNCPKLPQCLQDKRVIDSERTYSTQKSSSSLEGSSEIRSL